MKKTYLLILLSSIFLICGCQTKESAFMTIQTNPTGESIVLNDVNIGKSPVTVEIKTNEDGCFVNATNIKALPSKPKNYTQEITFAPFSDENSKEFTRVPEEIIFDLTKKSNEQAPVLNY